MGVEARVPPESTQPSAEELLGYRDLAMHLDGLRGNPRVMVSVMGQSEEGRDIFVVAITSPANRASIHAVRERMVELSTFRPDRKNLQQPMKYRESKSNSVEGLVPSVLLLGLSFGHEAAHVEGLVRLIDELAESNEDHIERILSELVVLVVPMINPDGRMKSIEEWRKYPLSTGCNGAGDSFGFLLNRDFLHLLHPETQAIVRTYQEWEPIVCVDLHEDKVMIGVTRSEVCWAPPYADQPYSADLPVDIMPLIDELGGVIAAEWKARGYNVMHDPEGKDALLPLTGIGGRADLTFVFHNSVSLLTESARTPGSQKWEDRVAQKHSATLAVLKHVSKNRIRFTRTVLRAKTTPPADCASSVYVIRTDQGDPSGLHRLVQTLERHGVEYYRVDSPYSAYVLPTDQPKGSLVRTLVREQGHAGQILLADFGVRACSLDRLSQEEREALEKAPLLRPIRMALPQASVIRRTSAKESGAYAFRGGPWGITLANRLLKCGLPVFRASQDLPLTAGQSPLVPGTFVVRDVSEAHLIDVAARLGVNLVSLPEVPNGALVSLSLPRVALFSGQGVDTQHYVHKAHLAWALSQMEFPYVECDATDILADRLMLFDTLVVPAGNATEIVEGRDPEGIWNSYPWEPAGPRCGIGQAGLKKIHGFVAGGGRYVGIGGGGGALACQGFAELLDAQLEEPIPNKGMMLLRMEAPDDPIFWGYRGCCMDDGALDSSALVAPYYGERLFGTPASPMLKLGPSVGVLATYQRLVPAKEFRPDPEVDPAFYRGRPAIARQNSGNGKVFFYGINLGFRGIWTNTFSLLANTLFTD